MWDELYPWHELNTPDQDKAIEFYTNAFGWEIEEMNMGEFTYRMFKVGGQAVAGISVCGNEQNPLPPSWSTYISVDDVDARAAKVEELGGKVLVPAMDIPTVGRMALVADPDGANFWLFKGESAQG